MARGTGRKRWTHRYDVTGFSLLTLVTLDTIPPPSSFPPFATAAAPPPESTPSDTQLMSKAEFRVTLYCFHD